MVGLVIAKGGMKTGGTPDKPWKRWWIQSAAGEYYSTFDTHIGQALVEAKRDGYPVDILFTTKTSGDTVTHTITSVAPSQPPDDEPPSTPPEADEPLPF